MNPDPRPRVGTAWLNWSVSICRVVMLTTAGSAPRTMSGTLRAAVGGLAALGRASANTSTATPYSILVVQRVSAPLEAVQWSAFTMASLHHDDRGDHRGGARRCASTGTQEPRAPAPASAHSY